MLRVVCVRTGTKYGPEYVEKLRDMVVRNLALGVKGTFECITDQPETWPGITNLPSDGFGGWWDKISLFKPGRWQPGDRIWYFDLDTLIVGPLDEVFKYDGEFAATGDFLRPNALQSAVMTWRAGECDDIWHRWLAEGMPRTAGGDQEFIERAHPNFRRLQREFPRAFVSFKVSAAYGIPPGAKVVCFHGHPRPHEVSDSWVQQVWKVGGGSANELVVVGNTPFDDVVANVKAACELHTPWLEKAPESEEDALIIGGGPSIGQLAPVIRFLAKNRTVFALNGAARWCDENGIAYDYHVMIDARPDMIGMVPSWGPLRIYASQCAPEVTKCADLLFHVHCDGVDACDIGGAGFEIGGGHTVGMVAPGVAYVLGFRKLHLFGFDSSYSAGAGHAYDQPLNAADRVYDAFLEDGSEWKSAPWMIQQVRDYQLLAPALTDLGCELTIYGNGLLPAVHQQMCKAVKAVDLRAAAILGRLNGAKGVRGVEVGTFVGDLAVRLLAGKPELSLTMVDPYQAPSGPSPWVETGDYHAHVSQDDQDAAYAKASSRVAIFGGRALMLRMPSVDAAPLVEERSQDFVFIDGDHSYEGVVADIDAWLPKVRPGGWLCGHDYRNTHCPFPGVDRAVDEWAAASGIPVEAGDNFTWFARVP